MELTYDEVTPMTDEQWERLINWYHKRMGRQIVQVPVAEKGELMDYEEANKLATQMISNYAQAVNRISVPEPTFKRLCEIADAVSALDDDGYSYNDNSGDMECIFCNGRYSWGIGRNTTKTHEPDCAYLKARLLIEHKEGDTQQ